MHLRLPALTGDDPETAVSRIIELVKTRIAKRFGLDPIRDIQVLCPMNRGGVGARSLNIELQAALNPAGDRKVERFGWTFAPGDKVMQIENDYDKEVYNGDIGYIDDVNPDDGELTASFDDRTVTYGFGELDMLVPAYAASIHKSQGSEYPAVVIPVMTQHYAMLQRNLLYTGVTRGKKLVVLVGQKKAVAIAVRNVSGRRRWSNLQEWLHPRASKSSQIASVIGHRRGQVPTWIAYSLGTAPIYVACERCVDKPRTGPQHSRLLSGLDETRPKGWGHRQGGIAGCRARGKALGLNVHRPFCSGRAADEGGAIHSPLVTRPRVGAGLIGFQCS